MHPQVVRRYTALLVTSAAHVALLALVLRSGPPRAETEIPARHKKQLIASLFFVQDPSALRLDDYVVAANDEGPAITLPMPQLPRIEAVAADSFTKGEALESAEDVAEVERLQGIYVKQINDRIARALQLTAAPAPEIPVDDPCVVRIIQDEHGEVLEVDAGECALETRSRDRLVRAIRAASPLPSPPDGLAMGSYLTIDASRL